jgi:hypothetical protein
MAQQTVNNGEALSVVRGKINDNFTELYTTKANSVSPALTGTPTAPTAVPATNTTQIATTAFAQSVATSLIDGAPTGLNTLAKIATSIANDAAFSTSVATSLGLKANLASPAFTGVPTAPTATAGTNTTQLATTAFVRAAVDALLDAPPGALDTLNELAAALGDDANFASTVTNSLALKANLASPALTGTPTAPTATAGTNTTQLATTAFVKAEADTRLPLAGGTMMGTASFQALTNLVTANASTLLMASAPHKWLNLVDSTGSVTCTFERASGRSSDTYAGSLLILQHPTTSRALTFALTGGTVAWAGAVPDFAAMTANTRRLLSYIIYGNLNLIVLADCGVVA